MKWLVYYNDTHFQSIEEVNPLPIDNSSVEIYYIIVNSLAAIMCSVVVASILWSEKAQVQGFNLYLLFNLVSDLILAWYRFTTRLLIFGFDIPALSFPYPCLIGTIANIAFIVANLWIHALTVYEVYKMLQYTHKCRRFKPSSRGIIIRQVSIIYGASIIVATLLTLNTRPFLDIRIHPETCIPKSYGTQSNVISYMMLALFTVCPWLYILYVNLMIQKNNLLPPQGECRFLALYFLWIALAASTHTIMMTATKASSISVAFVFNLAIQSILVSLVSLVKQDICNAVFDTFCCCSKLIERKRSTPNT